MGYANNGQGYSFDNYNLGNKTSNQSTSASGVGEGAATGGWLGAILSMIGNYQNVNRNIQSGVKSPQFSSSGAGGGWQDLAKKYYGG